MRHAVTRPLAQAVLTSNPKMILRNAFVRKISLGIFALLLFTLFSDAFAQTVEIKPKIIIAPFKQKLKQKFKKSWGAGETSVEKSIAVDAKVNINLCVKQGNLKINGWERSEIRAFVANGGGVGFKVQEKNKQNNIVWLKVIGSDPAKSNETQAEECLSGEDIELDVPRGAVVNVKGRTSRTTIESVRRVVVKNVGGDISLNNIEQGIHALTHEGDVTVENSGGAITLDTTNGNIVALDVAPSEIGDIFKAKTTSGAVTLQKIGHRQTEINSNSGAIRFAGEFHNGGQYLFVTNNGTISLTIPEKSSFRLNAAYGTGAFNSDFKLNIITVNNTSRAQSIAALLGSGDANVNLTTYSGAIRIKKQ